MPSVQQQVRVWAEPAVEQVLARVRRSYVAAVLHSSILRRSCGTKGGISLSELDSRRASIRRETSADGRVEVDDRAIRGEAGMERHYLSPLQVALFLSRSGAGSLICWISDLVQLAQLSRLRHLSSG